MDYIAILHKDDTSDWSVSFPDFPGCITAGKTLDEAKDNAREALAFHIEGMKEDGEAIPSPSSLDHIMHDPDFQDGVAFLVTLVIKSKPVRVNINIPDHQLALIDAYTKQAGISRSAFLVDSAINVISNHSHL